MSDFEDRLNELDDLEEVLRVYRTIQQKARKVEEKLFGDAEQPIDWLNVYRQIEAADNRLDDLMDQLDRKIAEEFPTKEEGSKTTNLGNFKVKTTGRRYYNIDRDKFSEDDIPEVAEQVFRNKKKVRKSALEDLKKVAPEAYDKVMEMINISEGKTGVNVEYQNN